MGYQYVPFGMLLFMLAWPAQGHNACYDGYWRYHSHTYTCFRLFRTDKNWTKARDYCSQVQLGSSYGVVTRLAKINDGYTNDFVRSLFPSRGWSCWIGLYYNATVKDFRWDGYPDETRKFSPTNWKDSWKKYVTIYSYGWEGLEGDETRHFVCQHDAKKVTGMACEITSTSTGISYTCKSQKSPVKAKCQWNIKLYRGYYGRWRQVSGPSHKFHTDNNGDISYQTTCSFPVYHSNRDRFTVKLKMYPDISGINLSTKQNALVVQEMEIAKPQEATFTVSSQRVNGRYAFLVEGSANVNITCWIQTGSPAVSLTTMSCDSQITNENIEQNTAPLFSSKLIREVKRDMHGRRCTCWGDHVIGRTEDFILLFKVVTKASKVTCQSHLMPDGLLVSCQIYKINPWALCVWSYRNENEQHFSSLSTNVNTEYSNDPYVDSENFVLYNSNCSVTLTSDTMTFKPGDVTVQVTVNPDEEGLDKDTTSGAFVTKQEIVHIDLPDKPVFKIFDETLQTLSPIQIRENDTINLSCEVQSGNPLVHSVTLECEFPFNKSNELNRHTVSGISYVIDVIASRDMNGESCTCIGNHLSGPILSSPLTFNVIYPTELSHFTVNGQTSLLEVDGNETLTLSCLADGNPLPSVNIRKLETNSVDTSAWQSDNSRSLVEIGLKAKCDHNGRYRCSAHSVRNSLEEFRDLDIRVRCPPTYCSETSRDLKMAVKPGQYQRVSLCVLAYPIPRFRLLKNSSTGWKTTEDFGDIVTNVTRFDSQQSIILTFPVLGPSHLGDYALEYSLGDGMKPSVLFFQLTASITHCNGEVKAVYEVTVGQSLSLDICVAAFPPPLQLTMQKAYGSVWHDYSDQNITITWGINHFDTLTNVTVTFLEVKDEDLGEYRLFEPSGTNGPVSSYLEFSLSEFQRDAQTGGGSGDAGSIAGAVVSMIIVIIIAVVVVFFIVRRRRNRDKQMERSHEGQAKENRAYQRDDYMEIDCIRQERNAEYKEKTDNDTYVYNNEVTVDDGLLALYGSDEKEESPETTYSNMGVLNNTADKIHTESDTAKGEDDLVYIQLDFNGSTDKKTKPERKSKQKSSPKAERQGDGQATEYATISAAATLRMKEEENDDSKGEEMEAVYANTKA